MKKIKVVTLCSGYDAQCLALDRLKRNYIDFDYELVAWAEIDKYAIQAHNALFPQWKDRNMGDITSCDWSKIKDNIDLLTYSTPCQSISSAGKQDGLKKGSGTASSIIWSVLNAIDVLRPKYLLMENVKALVSSKFIGDFHEWRSELSKRGYFNFAKVLNSKCYGIPQNRERIFMVSILDENANYHFPEPFPLDKRLKDVLEEDVDEKYYLSKKIIDTFIERNKINEDKGNGFKFEPTDGDCVASSVLTMPGSRPCDNYIKEPIACAMRGREVYGSKHVNNLIESGNIPADEVAFLDGYNQTVHTDVTATIKTNIDKENLMFVSIPQCLTPKRTEYGKKVRKEYESGELKESRHNMQQLEPRTDGVCNTITSVQKDNLVIEPYNPYDDGTCRTIKAQYYKNGMANFKRTDGLGATGVKVIANMYENNVQGGRIYDDKGISPTIGGNSGGNLQPKILEVAKKVEEMVNKSRSVKCGVSISKDNRIVAFQYDKKRSSVSEYKIDNDEGISQTVISAHEPKVYGESMEYRIRKLTERECFRLMDVDDADIDKIQAAGISKSQQYKMAGNSIVVSCLYHIFRKLFVDKGCEGLQLELFNQ